MRKPVENFFKGVQIPPPKGVQIPPLFAKGVQIPPFLRKVYIKI